MPWRGKTLLSKEAWRRDQAQAVQVVQEGQEDQEAHQEEDQGQEGQVVQGQDKADHPCEGHHQATPTTEDHLQAKVAHHQAAKEVHLPAIP